MMGTRFQTSRMGGLVASLVCALVGGALAAAQTGVTLADFSDATGTQPYAGLIADANGNLFGTTSVSGPGGGGTVFEIVKTSSGYASTPTVLVSFNISDGANPVASLIFDANGNIYGTAYEGGDYGCGVVFEILKDASTATGYATTPTVLASLNGSDGVAPFGALAFDSNGNLFGTAINGGTEFDPEAETFGNGTVFEIARDANSPTGYASTPTVLVSFNGNNGADPAAGLLLDANGNLYGTTLNGGPGFAENSGLGTVYEIPRDANSPTGYASTPTTLVAFDGSDGAFPYAGLIADGNGNLYGTFVVSESSYGGVFEIAKTSTGYASTPTTLASFTGANGAIPQASLILDASGSLFGTTFQGGAGFDLNSGYYGFGTVFKIARDTSTSTGYASAPAVLVSFDGTNGGANPYSSNLIADGSGNLYGTTLLGGVGFDPANGYYDGDGTVFEVTQSGFVPANGFVGTPGKADCKGKSISALAETYGGIAHAATSLGYSSVTALQNAVTQYCGQ